MNQTETMSPISLGIDFAKSGDPSKVHTWLEEGNSPNQYDSDGWTPLLWASARGHDAVVRLLVENPFEQADLAMAHRESGALAVHMAGQSGDVETAEILLSHRPEHLNAILNLNGHTVLLQAVFYGHLELTEMLLESGADTSITTARGLGPMELATQFQNQAMMDLLRPFDSPAEAKAAYYQTYLERIVPVIPEGEQEAQALADELVSTIEEGIKEAAQNPDAVAATLAKVAALVENRQADVNRLGGPLQQPALIVTATGNNGWPAIPAVAELRNRLARYLLDHGADPTLHEKHPMAVQTVIRAAVFNHLDILKMCAEVLSPQEMADAINEYPAVNGLTAMHDTVLRASMAGPDRFDGYVEQIRFFLAHGGRTDIEDFAGVTQRNIAESTANLTVRKRLLDVIDSVHRS
ncbi:MAG: ankyrin repeat domain-containing protein [Trueperaceae bacterium]|nr:MAG: ankyrin repeat domain-containing protein [Trueperaceae bacterium]